MKYQVIYNDGYYGDFFKVSGNSKSEVIINIKSTMHELNLTKSKIIKIRKIK